MRTVIQGSNRHSLPTEVPDWAPLAGLRAEVRSSPRRRQRVSTVLFGALLVLLAVWLGRGLWDSVLDRLEWLSAVHPDRSSADSGVRREARPLAWLTYRAADGREVRALVDEERLGAFLAGQVYQLESARAELRRAVRADTEEAVTPLFEAMAARVAGFTDWYLAWGTGYELLRVALVSAAGHAVTPGVMDLRDAVAQDVERHVEDRYRDLVLKPEESDPLVRTAYQQALVDAHRRTLALAAQTDSEFLRFLGRESRVLENPSAQAAPHLTLDWAARTRKLVVPDLGQTGFESLRGLTLAAAGAMAGRTVGVAAGQALAQGVSGRALAPSAARMGSQLAAPALSRLAGSVAGATVGAGAGPLGLALGGAAGLGVDYLVHAATASVRRDDVEAAAHGTLAAHRSAWQRLLGDSVAGTVDLWVDDLQAFLVQHAGRN